MIKFLLITLSVTSLSCAREYDYYRSPSSSHYSYYADDEDGRSYGYSSSRSPRPSEAEILKIKTDILDELKKQAIHNAQSCNDRQECWSLDQESLQNIQGKYRKNTYLQDFFSELRRKLKQATDSDIAVTELTVYDALPDKVRQQYLDGVRINDPKKIAGSLMAKYSGGQRFQQQVQQSGPNVKFNIDDLKMYILQRIEKNHQGCRGGRENCLQSDVRIVTETSRILGAENEHDQASLEQLTESMQDEAFKQPFNTVSFYEGYTVTLIKQQPFLYKSPERIEWNNLVKKTRAIHYRDPQVLNHAEVKKGSTVKAQIERKLEKQGEDLLGNIIGQLNDGGSKQEGHGGGLFGSLFGR